MAHLARLRTCGEFMGLAVKPGCRHRHRRRQSRRARLPDRPRVRHSRRGRAGRRHAPGARRPADQHRWQFRPARDPRLSAGHGRRLRRERGRDQDPGRARRAEHIAISTAARVEPVVTAVRRVPWRTSTTSPKAHASVRSPADSGVPDRPAKRLAAYRSPGSARHQAAALASARWVAGRGARRSWYTAGPAGLTGRASSRL